MKKRSITIAGHATSITLEDEFWAALKTIADARSVSMNALVTDIDARKGNKNLSSALRVFVLEAVQKP